MNNTSSGTVSTNRGTISQNAGAVTFNSASASIYANTNPACESLLGTVTTESDPALPALLAQYYPQPSSSAENYNASLANLSSSIEEAARAIAMNLDGKTEQTIYYSVGDSLPVDVFKTLKDCEGVKLDFRCTYNEKDYHYVIKGGKDMKLDETIEWYGPLYLEKIYGVVED